MYATFTAPATLSTVSRVIDAVDTTARFFTSPTARRWYRAAGTTARFTGLALFHGVMLCAAAAYFAGVATRRLVDWLLPLLDAYVEQCQAPAPVLELCPVTVPVAALPAAEAPARVLVTPAHIHGDRVLVTPVFIPDVIVAPAPKKRGRKPAAKTATPVAPAEPVTATRKRRRNAK